MLSDGKGKRSFLLSKGDKDRHDEIMLNKRKIVTKKFLKYMVNYLH